MTDQILVCDDNGQRVQRWVDTVGEHLGTARACTGTDLADLVTALSRRSEAARTEQAEPENEPVLDAADSALYAFLDFDLTPDRESRAAVDADDTRFIDALRGRTGERLAYLMRAHSDTGYIVVVNQHFKKSTFDLTMQRFATSFADLNVSSADLTNAALWTGATSTGGYNPWHWPILASAARTTVAVRGLLSDLDQPILSTLGLSDASFHSRQLDVFTGDPTTATFKDLLGSGLGLDPKDEATDGNSTTMAASVLSRWLGQVLAAQNVISDLPHLLTRFPQLGTEPLFRSAALKTTPLDELPPALAEHRLETLSELLGRDVWDVTTARRLASKESAFDASGLAFCEDTSTFEPVDESSEIETDLPGPYARRFIKHLDSVTYTPVIRLLV